MNTLRKLQPLWRVLIVFLFFSVADLYLTWKLIERDTSDVIENNPLAAIVLTTYGWLGLAGYKFALVLTVFALALAVERRRALGGLCLLVFACGVHAAVVVSSVFMCFATERTDTTAVEAFDAYQHQQRQTLPAGAMALLCQSPVQAELKLTDAQKREIDRAAAYRQQLSQNIGEGHLDSCQSTLMLIAVSENTIVRELTPAQFQRLAQLTLQKRGIFALQDADMIGALRLSDHQMIAIRSMVEQLEVAVSIEIDLPVQDVESKLLSVLTDVQKMRWNEINGVPFCFRTGKSIPVTADATE